MKKFTCLDKGIELAVKGYQVFPLANNAKQPPKNHHGYLEATCDQETIFSWYQANPFRNLGLRLDTSNLLVVDIDLHSESNNGRQSLLTLKKHGMFLPNDTYIERSPNGGLHYFFSFTGEKVHKANVWPGIDLLTDFTVIAPSEVDGKPYQPVGNRNLANIKPAPGWIIDKLKATSEVKAVSSVRIKKYTGKLLDKIVAGTGQGDRNVWLTRLIGQLFMVGAEPETVRQLAYVFNEKFIDPPLLENDVGTIFNSILRREVKTIEYSNQ
ncbi:bifunctional DNA primase/polymerase [Lentilactobacillus kefiri]|uniref:bifunctional DNA primase/polymerase n=1 Tax=Lentilactobacillus kefiri TaxID=33962 RepID=UPI003F953507